MKRLIVFVILLICCMQWSGCAGIKDGDMTQEDREKEVKAVDAVISAEDLVFHSEYIINTMEPLSDGTLLLIVSEGDNPYFERVENGEIHKMGLEDYYSVLSYGESTDEVYAYNRSKGQIEIKDRDFQTQRVLVSDFWPFEVKDMEMMGAYLYALCVGKDPYLMDEHAVQEEDDGYMDFGEKLYRIDLMDGTMTEMDRKGIISFAKSSEGRLYLYVYKDGSYYVESYDETMEEVFSSQETNDIGYLFSFSVIGDDLYYIGLNTNGICVKDLKSGEIEQERREVVTLLQCDFDTVGDQLIYLNRSGMDIHVVHGRNKTLSAKEDNTLVIGLTDIYSLPYSFDEARDRSGFKIKTRESPIVADASFDRQLVQKLVEGDPDIDVFILTLGDRYSEQIMKDGVCRPLDDIEELVRENHSFFAEVSDAMKTESGRIWGIPLSAYESVLLAYPDNMTRFGVTEEDFKDYFAFCRMLGRVNTSDERRCFIYGLGYGADLLSDYITSHGQAGYEQKLFREYFETMWGGWTMYGQFGYENHPLMGKADPHTEISLYEGCLSMDPQKTICNLVPVKEILSREELRQGTVVYPMPLLAGDDRNLISIPYVAVINPNGRHMENAIEYLKLVSRITKEQGNLGIVYNDKEAYAGRYDMQDGVLQAIYEINSDSVVCMPGIRNEILSNEVEAYQHGEMSLEEVICSVQKRADEANDG